MTDLVFAWAAATVPAFSAQAGPADANGTSLAVCPRTAVRTFRLSAN